MERVFQVLERLRTKYTTYIGKKSICKLSTFLCGYEAAIMDLTGERVRFDALFQNYIENKFQAKETALHWDHLLEHIFSQETAFDEFYCQLDGFKRAYKASDLMVFLVSSSDKDKPAIKTYQLLYTSKGTCQHLGYYDTRETVRNALIAYRKEKEYCNHPDYFFVISN